MQTKEEILDQLVIILAELFEIEKDDIKPEARLYEELDLDSIDAIDMVVKLQKITGKKVKPDDFRSVRTVDDVVEAVYKLVHE